jgi:hypothetical protein
MAASVKRGAALQISLLHASGRGWVSASSPDGQLQGAESFRKLLTEAVHCFVDLGSTSFGEQLHTDQPQGAPLCPLRLTLALKSA